MPTTHFCCAELPDLPWKNGLGMTKELVTWPPGSTMDDFDWRASIAHIAKDCSFSSFPGINRVITLLTGSGIVMKTDDGAVCQTLDQPLKPFSFSGDLPIHVELIGGGCRDFNLMTRGNTCNGRVDVVRDETVNFSDPQGLFLVTEGQWKYDDQLMESGDGLCWHQFSDKPKALIPNSTKASILLVSIQPSCSS